MEGVLRDCPSCGKTYTADPGRLKHGRQTTCSRACSYELRANGLSNSVEVACATCGKVIIRPPSKTARARHGVFCSRECHYAGRSIGATKRIVTKPYTFTPEGKAAQLASCRTPKGERAPRVETSCKTCGKPIRRIASDAKRKPPQFCSVSCIGTYQRADRNPAWRGGYRPYYGPDWRPLQREARKRDGYTCQRCGITQREAGRQLDVHHITPVSSFPNPNDANTLDNVTTLCHPCHMAVEWELGQR